MKKKFLTAFLFLILVINMTACSPSSKAYSDDWEPAVSAPSAPVSTTASDSAVSASSDSSEEKDGTEKYVSLEEWINSEEKKQIVTQANDQLSSIGVSVDFFAEDNILVMAYSFAKLQKMDASQSEIDESFAQKVAPVFADSAASLYESFESEYGLTLEDIKVVVYNADGKELYSKYHSES